MRGASSGCQIATYPCRRYCRRRGDRRHERACGQSGCWSQRRPGRRWCRRKGGCPYGRAYVSPGFSTRRRPALGSHHVIRKEAGLFYRTSSSVRLWWEFKEPKGPKGPQVVYTLMLSLVWMCVCRSRLPGSGKTLPQVVHGFRRSPEWVRRWRLRPQHRVRVLPHKVHSVMSLLKAPSRFFGPDPA